MRRRYEFILAWLLLVALMWLSFDLQGSVVLLDRRCWLLLVVVGLLLAWAGKSPRSDRGE